MKKIFRHSRRGSALLIGLIITILLSVLVISFLEKVLGVGKNVKNIEQSTQAYYYATNIIEKQLLANTKLRTQPWLTTQSDSIQGASTGEILQVDSYIQNGNLPSSGKGNSPFSDDYNILSLENPVQIVIPNGIRWDNVGFIFRVPPLDTRQNKTESKKDANLNSTGAIMWSFGNADKVLYSSGATDGIFYFQDINDSEWSTLKRIDIRKWLLWDAASYNTQEQDFNSFSQSLNCNKINSNNPYGCTLKLSLVRPLKLTTGEYIPFVEYKITGLQGNNQIPLQFMTLHATGKSGQLQRTRTAKIPQLTTNTALDFAVLQ